MRRDWGRKENRYESGGENQRKKNRTVKIRSN